MLCSERRFVIGNINCPGFHARTSCGRVRPYHQIYIIMLVETSVILFQKSADQGLEVKIKKYEASTSFDFICNLLLGNCRVAAAGRRRRMHRLLRAGRVRGVRRLGGREPTTASSGAGNMTGKTAETSPSTLTQR